MTPDEDKHALGSAIAGGAIAVALIETLFDKGILSLDEARGVLDRAMRMAGIFSRSAGGFEAAQIIASMQRERFNAGGRKP